VSEKAGPHGSDWRAVATAGTWAKSVSVRSAMQRLAHGPWLSALIGSGVGCTRGKCKWAEIANSGPVGFSFSFPFLFFSVLFSVFLLNL
jgi:hypothetical protein